MNATTTPCEQETGLSLKELMLLPVVLMSVMFQVFVQHVAKLKESRRTRPLPKAWKEHWPNLRLAEWHIRELTAAGIEQLLSGEDLDLTRLSMNPDPPEDFGQTPASAFELHRRFEAIASFHADPERYIRRTAERVLARDGERDPLGRANPLIKILRALDRYLQSRPQRIGAPLAAPSPFIGAWILGIPAPP